MKLNERELTNMQLCLIINVERVASGRHNIGSRLDAPRRRLGKRARSLVICQLSVRLESEALSLLAFITQSVDVISNGNGLLRLLMISWDEWLVGRLDGAGAWGISWTSESCCCGQMVVTGQERDN